MNITKADQHHITTDEVREFDANLVRVLTKAEVADMRLARLMQANDEEEWPEGYEFSSDAVAAYAILANSLENEAGRMLGWAKAMRDRSTHLWFVRGPAVEGGADDA